MDLMNHVCLPMLDRSVIVFSDDILVYSKTQDQHDEHLREALDTPMMESLYVKFSKCKFWLRKVQFSSAPCQPEWYPGRSGLGGGCDEVGSSEVCI